MHIAAPINTSHYIQIIEGNLNAKSMDFARLPGGEAHEGNPAWFLSGLKRAGYNGIVRANLPARQLDTHIEQALEPFRQLDMPMTWWVDSQSEPAQLGRALQNHGLHHLRDMFGMAAPLDSLPAVVAPDMEHSFEAVQSRHGLEEWLPLFMDTFDVPQADNALVLDVFDRLSFGPHAQWHHFLIRVEGRVVATGSLHLGAGVAGLYNIGTHPAYRQHGLGSAITLLTFQQALQWGYEWGTLQTTYPNALRIYHRMGFEVYCKIEVYQRTAW